MSHNIITQSKWAFQLWNESQINKKKNLLKEIDDLNHDLKLKPKQHLNLMTQGGLEELAKSRVPGITATKNTHHAIGTGTTEETQADTALETQVAIKEIQASTAFSGTERYATAFNHAGTDYDITEAGIFTAETNGILIVHVTSRSISELRAGKTLTIATTLTHSYEAPT